MKTYSSWNGAVAACNEAAELEWWWQCHEVYATPAAAFFFVMGHVSDKENQEQLGNTLILSRQIEDDGEWSEWIFRRMITVTAMEPKLRQHQDHQPLLTVRFSD